MQEINQEVSFRGNPIPEVQATPGFTVSDSKEVIDRCPPEYYCDYIEWLSMVSGAIAVWNTAYMGKPNKKQLSVLKKLKINGIYNGPVT